SFPSTPTVPCSMPTGTVRRKRRWTSRGRAEVVRSQSSGWRPASASRTAPPTAHAEWPASSRRRAMRRTSGGGWRSTIIRGNVGAVFPWPSPGRGVIFGGTSTPDAMNLVHFLRQSRATGAFKDAVAAFLRDGAANDRVAFDGYAPPVKVERTLAKLLEAFPEMELERVVIQGASGCEYFRGKLSAFGPEGERRIRFHWDCKWRAEQEGW